MNAPVAVIWEVTQGFFTEDAFDDFGTLIQLAETDEDVLDGIKRWHDTGANLLLAAPFEVKVDEAGRTIDLRFFVNLAPALRALLPAVGADIGHAGQTGPPSLGDPPVRAPP